MENKQKASTEWSPAERVYHRGLWSSLSAPIGNAPHLAFSARAIAFS
jgi:hypothetical protein